MIFTIKRKIKYSKKINKTKNLNQSMHAQSLSSGRLFVTPWTVARQAPLSKGFSRQEHWGGLPSLLQEILLTQGSNLCLTCLLRWQAGSLPLRHRESPRDLSPSRKMHLKYHLAWHPKISRIHSVVHLWTVWLPWFFKSFITSCVIYNEQRLCQVR